MPMRKAVSLLSLTLLLSHVPSSGADIVDLEKEAAAGNRKAQFELGLRYEEGQGVPKDPAKAIKWWESAATKGEAGAQFGLGVKYASADGAPENLPRAYMWLTLAAEKHIKQAEQALAELTKQMTPEQVTEAWFHLGYMTSRYGAERDKTKALNWYMKAAATREMNAQFILGFKYAKGDGVPKNTDSANFWFNYWQPGENASAQTKLGMMYLSGEGFVKDEAKAFDGSKKLRRRATRMPKSSWQICMPMAGALRKTTAKRLNGMRKRLSKMTLARRSHSETCMPMVSVSRKTKPKPLNGMARR